MLLIINQSMYKHKTAKAFYQNMIQMWNDTLCKQSQSVLFNVRVIKYINLKESNGSLKSFKSINSIIYSFIFIHSVTSKNDKMYL